MDRVKTFAGAASARARMKDGIGLGKLLLVPLGERPSGNGYILTRDQQHLVEEAKVARSSVVSICNSGMRDELLGALVGYILECLVCISSTDFHAAYKHQVAAFNAILEYFSLKETAEQPATDTTWVIPVIKRVGDDMRRIAYMVCISSYSFPRKTD